MKYLNKKDQEITAAYIEALAPDHVERVIFDRTLEGLLPSYCVGQYADASEAMKKALASVFEFRELVRGDVERQEAEVREFAERLADPDGKTKAEKLDDEIPF